MNKNIKYLIEEILKFDTADYLDDNIIDTETVDNIIDPVDDFIMFLNSYEWKPYKGFDYPRGIHIIEPSLKETYMSIYEELNKLIDKFSENYLSYKPIDKTAYFCETSIYNEHGMRGTIFYIIDAKTETKNIAFIYIHHTVARFLGDEIIIGIYDTEHIYDVINRNDITVCHHGFLSNKLIDKVIKKFNIP